MRVIVGIIYKITNLINGKIYVGQTRRTLEERIGEHKRHKNGLIGLAIKKYGWKNFKVEVLEECTSSDQLNEREIFWIAKLNCKIPNGYNKTDGGDGSYIRTAENRAKLSAVHKGQKGRKHTPEELEKISAGRKGKKQTPESNAKNSAAHLGKKRSLESRAKQSATMKGKKHSAETCAKQSAAMKKYWAKKRELKLKEEFS